MKVLITGAAGFIGSSVAAQLAHYGNEVVGLDSFNDYYSPALKHRRVAMLKGIDVEVHNQDLCDTTFTRMAMLEEKPDVVLHFAAQPGVRHARRTDYARSNVEALIAVLDAAKLAGVKKVVYASSSSVYGDAVGILHESREPRPKSLYGATKLSGEIIAATYSTPDTQITGLRFFTVYGPYGRPDMAYWKFADRMCNGASIPIFGDGSMRRDFTYINDVVDAVHCVVDRPVQPGHTIYNVGRGDPHTVSQMVEMLGQVFDRVPMTHHVDCPPTEVGSTWADTTAFRLAYGWSPRVSLGDGLQQFARFYKEYSNGEA